jgi:hypothetical protein
MINNISRPGNIIDNVGLIDILNGFIKKLFYHQDGYQPEYKPYMLDINCAVYPFISHTNLNITPEQIEILINDGYTMMEKYYKNQLIS